MFYNGQWKKCIFCIFQGHATLLRKGWNKICYFLPVTISVIFFVPSSLKAMQDQFYAKLFLWASFCSHPFKSMLHLWSWTNIWRISPPGPCQRCRWLNTVSQSDLLNVVCESMKPGPLILSFHRETKASCFEKVIDPGATCMKLL